MKAADLSPPRGKVGGYPPHPMPWLFHAPPCVPLPVGTSHNFDGMQLSLLALCGSFACPQGNKSAPLIVPVLWRCPSKGRTLNLPLWISFLLLSDSCISGCGLSEFCASPLKHSCPVQAWPHHTFHKHILDPSSKASIKMLVRPSSEASLCRFESEPSLTTLYALFQPVVPFPP